ncbi:TPA: hypothetical protein N0F65_004861 [Lagenidium giganteum]|uniref:GlcNac transferase n=1 Tax=Lagenidium giganteum TaxID=4803 RepID=A0AAV2Z2C8_9STRA|nr:TPA: hypothetical protein N0F65_004861 [Lagenidium giganteum]
MNMLRLAAVLTAACLTTAAVHGAAEAVDYTSEMGIINSDRTVKLDPSVQHIPLDPKLAHLRPPPPRVPDKFDIFVGISVFRDGYRCAKTLFTGFKRAKDPDRLYFGVVDQVNPGDAKCIDEFCQMAAAEWPERGACPYRDHIRIDEHLADDSRGPTLARHYQQKLIKDEEFCLQLDGHSIFTNLWDENMLAEWKRINNEMAVLTTYLHHIHDFVKENGDNTYPGSLPHLCTTMRGGNGCVRNVGASMITGSKFPQMSALWGAGLSFGKCHAERRVLIDSHTLWMFDGEEFLRASHLWTHGYDLYSPSELGSVVYHNYSKVPARFEHVKVDQKKKDIETDMGTNRFFLIVNKPFKGRVDTFEMEKYAFGNVRTFDEYLKFSGVTFEEGKNDTDSCKQLHWVPYQDPTEIEEIVGGGWKLYPKKTVAEPQEVAAPTMDEKAATQAIPTPKVQVPKDAVTQVPLEKNADTGAIGGEQKPVNLRQQGYAPNAGNSSVWFFPVIVVAVLFVMFSNDEVSRAIKRQFRMKTSASTK